MNWNMVMLRGMKVPVAACLAAFGLALLVRRLGLGSSSPEMLRLASWILSGGVGVFVIGVLALGWRLRKWEQGEGPYCGHCGGPVGGRRDGKVVWGRRLFDYRTCYNCARHSPVEAG